jgi:CofD-related protein of GAK system
MIKAGVTRERPLPDPSRLGRYLREPELGPRVLFFSGGSALRRTAHELTAYTHNSIHIVTPFDSGGSSAKLRQSFHMPAVGDVRTRLMALADKSIRGNPEIFALFAHRLPKDRSPAELREELERMGMGDHPLIDTIQDPLRKIVIRSHVRDFCEQMGLFDLRGASIGNLVLASGYLTGYRRLEPVIFLFSKLVKVLGLVRPVVNADLHLAAELENGRIVIGQHRITGKEVPPLPSPIKRLWLTAGLDDPEPVDAVIGGKIRDRILDAELICYPMGSFYTSVVANLLPGGVCRAIAGNPCPKVFVPNTSPDPELMGHDLADQVQVLQAVLTSEGVESGDVLDLVLIDSKSGFYPGGVDRRKLHKLGVEILDLPLISPRSSPLIDPKLLVPILLSLV